MLSAPFLFSSALSELDCHLTGTVTCILSTPFFSFLLPLVLSGQSQASKCQGLDMQFSKKATLRAPLNQSLVVSVSFCVLTNQSNIYITFSTKCRET